MGKGCVTNDDFRKLLKVTSRTNDWGMVTLSVGVHLLEEGHVSKVYDKPEVRKKMIGDLTERLLRRIYDDRRKEMAQLIEDLVMSDPHGRTMSEGFRQAADRLMAAAKRQ